MFAAVISATLLNNSEADEPYLRIVPGIPAMTVTLFDRTVREGMLS